MGNCFSFCTTNNNDEHAHQEQEEDAPLPQPQIVLLTSEGQHVRSILDTKPEELPLCVINDNNELMNNIAAVGEFLLVIRSMSADDLFVRDAQPRQEDEQRAHQEQDDEEEELLQPRIVLLTPEGQNVRSVLAKKPEDLRPCVMNEINALMNDIATGDFLSTVKTSLVDDLFLKDEEQHRREKQEQQRGLTITIVHKDWHKIERQYETAVRLFPDILQETWDGINLIQWMSMCGIMNCYNLRLVSLIPIIVRLGIQLQQFNTLERGGLLSVHFGRTPLQCIICYHRNELTTNTADECFSVVVERLREEKLFMKEDIQQHNLVGYSITKNNNGYFFESQIQYLFDWDPMTLSLPCYPEKGDYLPIHWAARKSYKDSRKFKVVFMMGMKYFHEKLGFAFSEGTHRFDNNTECQLTPYRRGCERYGQGRMRKLVTDCIQEHCSSSTSTTSTVAAHNRETSLLLSAITDDSIHFFGVYILLRKDPVAVLSRLCDAVHDPAVALSNIQQQVLRVEGQTCSTVTNNKTHSSNDNNSVGATDTIAASMTTTTVSATTTTVSSPPTATAAPRDSLASIPFQASMDPTVSTSGTGTGTANNNKSHNISEEEAEEELKIVGQEEVAAATSTIAATEAVTSRGVVEEEEEEPQENMDNAAVVAIPEGVLGSDDAAYALLTTAVVESASYDDSTRTTVDVDADQDKDELKPVETEVAAAIAATDVVEAVTSREVVVAKEDIIPTIADDEDEAPGGGVEESKEEAPEVEDEGAAEAPPTPTTTS